MTLMYWDETPPPSTPPVLTSVDVSQYHAANGGNITAIGDWGATDAIELMVHGLAPSAGTTVYDGWCVGTYAANALAPGTYQAWVTLDVFTPSNSLTVTLT
jgi:hypothetical protein